MFGPDYPLLWSRMPIPEIGSPERENLLSLLLALVITQNNLPLPTDEDGQVLLQLDVTEVLEVFKPMVWEIQVEPARGGLLQIRMVRMAEPRTPDPGAIEFFGPSQGLPS